MFASDLSYHAGDDCALSCHAWVFLVVDNVDGSDVVGPALKILIQVEVGVGCRWHCCKRLELSVSFEWQVVSLS